MFFFNTLFRYVAYRTRPVPQGLAQSHIIHALCVGTVSCNAQVGERRDQQS